MDFEKTYKYDNRDIEVCVRQKEALHSVSINVVADNWEEANEILHKFAKEKLSDILKELNLTIINHTLSDKYLSWYYVYFSADYINALDIWKKLLNDTTKRLYKRGHENIFESTDCSRFEYDRLKAEYNILLAQMMELGYELKPKSCNDIIEETFVKDSDSLNEE